MSNQYKTIQGTSMASPHVAGVAGLILAQDPTLSPLEIKDRILGTVDPISTLADKTVSGGRLNAFKALDYSTPVKLVFSSERDGNLEIYLMSIEGGQVTESRLTYNSTWDSYPTWSPDGTRIAFVSKRDGIDEVYVMEVIGGKVVQRQLTANASVRPPLSWTPDGSHIIYLSGSFKYSVDVNGGNIERLERDTDRSTPVWSPDGRRITYTLSGFGNTDIYVANSDRSSEVRLTDAGRESSPAWSPDGNKIAFMSLRDSNDWDIYVMDADGSNQTELTNNSIQDLSPTWSPDGNKIAFMSARSNGDNGVFIIGTDGNNLERLSSNPSRDNYPDWLPNLYTNSPFFDLPLAPLITSLIPRASRVDRRIFIIGSNFGQSGIVRLRGETISTTRWTDSSIQFTVPKNARTSMVTVQTDWGTQGISNEVELDLRSPFLTSHFPPRAKVGDKVTIEGGNFGSEEGGYVSFGNVRASTYTEWTPSRIVALVPSGARSGEIKVVSLQGESGVRHLVVSNVARTEGELADRIVFVSNGDIYVMDTDGQNQQKLTNGLRPSDPIWSPDRWRIAFASRHDDNTDIYVMDADGKNAVKLTDYPGFDGEPAWSPDGRRIAFTSNREGRNKIYVMDASGTNVQRISGDGVSADQSPTWSPDGEKIAFDSRRGGLFSIYMMDADGKNEQRLTNDTFHNRSPAFSLDGRRIAFTSIRGLPFSSIYVMNLERNNVLEYRGGCGHSDKPSWSSDGTKIVFESICEGIDGQRHFVYVMDVTQGSASHVDNLTNVELAARAPNWSPPIVPDVPDVSLIPQVTFLFPNTAAGGDLIEIRGENLGTSSTVRLRGTQLKPLSWSNTLIRVAVPPNARSGNITVRTETGTSNAQRLEITSPYFLALRPRQAIAGEEIQIFGGNWGTARASRSYVQFGSVRATTYPTWSSNQIEVQVPAGVRGDVEVKVVTAQGQSATRILSVEPPIAGPSLIALSPRKAKVGEEIKLYGRNWGTSRTSGSYVQFGTVRATTYSAWHQSQIAVEVPSGIRGTVEVKVVTAQGQSDTEIFTVEEESVFNLPAAGPFGYRPGVVTNHPQQLAFEFESDGNLDLSLTYEAQHLSTDELKLYLNDTYIRGTSSAPSNSWERIFVHLDRSILRNGTNVFEFRHTINSQRTSGFGHWLIRDIVVWERFAKLIDESGISQNSLTSVGLGLPYPTPFNASVSIPYHLPTDMAVQVSVYNLSGQPVATLHDGYQPAGRYHLTWQGIDDSGRTVSTGVYLIVLKAETLRQTTKVILLQ